jgi:hypothetical protein
MRQLWPQARATARCSAQAAALEAEWGRPAVRLPEEPWLAAPRRVRMR